MTITGTCGERERLHAQAKIPSTGIGNDAHLVMREITSKKYI